jgi:hypothetical protein
LGTKGPLGCFSQRWRPQMSSEGSVVAPHKDMPLLLLLCRSLESLLTVFVPACASFYSLYWSVLPQLVLPQSLGSSGYFAAVALFWQMLCCHCCSIFCSRYFAATALLRRMLCRHCCSGGCFGAVVASVSPLCRCFAIECEMAHLRILCRLVAAVCFHSGYSAATVFATVMSSLLSSCFATAASSPLLTAFELLYFYCRSNLV